MDWAPAECSLTKLKSIPPTVLLGMRSHPTRVIFFFCTPRWPSRLRFMAYHPVIVLESLRPVRHLPKHLADMRVNPGPFGRTRGVLVDDGSPPRRLFTSSPRPHPTSFRFLFPLQCRGILPIRGSAADHHTCRYPGPPIENTLRKECAVGNRKSGMSLRYRLA